MATQNEKEAIIFSISQLFAALEDNMKANAVRFDEDRIPTYGLRVAEQTFGRAHKLIDQQIIPLGKPITIVLEAAIKGAGIGIKAWAQSMKGDWGMIAPKCGAHCKLCNSRSTALYFEALSKILQYSIASKSQWDAQDSKNVASVCNNITKSLVDYADEVVKTDSFSQAWVAWDSFGDDLVKLAEPLTKLLSTDY